MIIEYKNLLLTSDSYKYSHYLQYPKDTVSLFSFLESRSIKNYSVSIFFGLQYYLKKYLSQPFTMEDIVEAEEIITVHGLPFNTPGFKHMLEKHGGFFPVRIRAPKEGTIIPNSNVLMTIESTDPEVFWCVNWLETLLLKIWYPITVATQSHFIRQDIYNSLARTSDDPDSQIDFKRHAFGSRASTSDESAEIGGIAELTASKGTDTVSALKPARLFYNCKMAGYSIPASEHSTICVYGKENEVKAFENMLDQFAKPGAIVACVSDSYDIYNACSNLWGTQLKQKIIDSGATLVIRPDSGDPPEVVSKCLHILGEKFGTKTNSKGYKVLNYVRLIQGDGVNRKSINKILNRINSEGFSTDNIAFGMGAASMTGTEDSGAICRDTLDFAFKACSTTRNGIEFDIYKEPITDPGKNSKRGRLDLIKNKYGQLETIKLAKGSISSENSIMETCYENGKVLVNDSLDNIRERINCQTKETS